MNKTCRELFEQILALPPAERAALMEKIRRAVDGRSDAELSRVWAREAEKRIDAYDRDQLAGRDYRQVKVSLQQLLSPPSTPPPRQSTPGRP